MKYEDFSGLLMDGSSENVEFFNYAAKRSGFEKTKAVQAFRPHANWLGRGISEAEQLEIKQSMPYQEV